MLFTPFSTKSNEGPQMNVNTHGSEEKSEIHSTNPLPQGEAPKKDNNNVPFKPLVDWTKEEVQQWFLRSDDFKDFASRFPLSGKHLAGLSETTFKETVRNPAVGNALYNAVQELQKRDAMLMSSGTEGISTTEQVISFRETTISGLDNLLDKERVCLIRAPPYSGKTTIGQLLARHVKQKGHTAVRLSTLGKGSKYNDIEECWIRKTKRSWKEWFKATTPTTLIIDEAQNWYDYGHGHPFWQDVKEEKQWRTGDADANPNLRILFISAYGERPEAKSEQANIGTPIDFSEEETLNFPFVRLTRNEFDELVSCQNQSSESTVLLSKSVANVIYNATLGHAGLAKKTVKLIERNFHRKRDDPAPSDADIIEYLLSRTYYDYICRTRAVPEREFTEDEKRILREIILGGYAQPIDKKVATELLKSGLVADIGGRLEFAAPILKIIFIDRLYGSKRAEKGPTSFEGFIVDCIHRLNRNTLKEAFSRRGLDGPLYERQWQMEFYRAATSLLTDKQVISADVGAIFGSEGKLDFYLNGNLKWGIELLREGDDALGHAQRFQEGGDYWIMREKLRAYGLLDFRSSKPREKEMKDNFWYLIYDENFEKITIRRKGTDDVVVPLL